RTWFEIRDALEPRNVEQDTACENAILEVMNGILLVAAFQHGVGIGLVAVIEHAVLVDVRKRIQMSVSDAMVTNADPVIADGKHLVLVGKRIVDRLDGV